MMAIPRATRTHLIYQFIILTLLFLGIGYNELLPERKFVLLLTFVPMFLYQLLILSCCMELLPVPSWMHFCEPVLAPKVETKTEKIGTDSLPSSPVTSSKQEQVKKAIEFVDLSERLHESRRWENSVVNLGTAQKHFASAQKSKSWINMSDSTKSLDEASLSREGSLDVLPQKNERKLRSSHVLSKTERAQFRKERANKAKSWRPGTSDFGSSDGKSKPTQPAEIPAEPSVPAQVLKVSEVQQSEFSKSYSFPFRQKRLGTWLEMKETETKDSNQSLDMPYWQTVGYNLAVKYEARRRRRAVSSPTKLNYAGEAPSNEANLQKSTELPKPYVIGRQYQKKAVKSASNCINKIKASFTNLVSKKKDEFDNVIVNPSKGLKPSLSFKSKNKNVSYHAKEENKTSMPEFPQFLNNKRPLIFYPKNIPFEKERFETDVQKKMAELEHEQNESRPRCQHK